MNEIWKDVPYTNGLYKVSNSARVESHNTKNGKVIFLKPCFNRERNYLYVSVQTQGYRKNWILHRLVAEVFIPNPLNLPSVDHVDGNKLNNAVSNLEWVTYAENSRRARAMGLVPAYDHLKSARLLTPEKAMQIYLAEGKHRDIAKRFGVGNSTVTHIKLGSRWGKYTIDLKKS